jgi:hypothetical protein
MSGSESTHSKSQSRVASTDTRAVKSDARPGKRLRLVDLEPGSADPTAVANALEAFLRQSTASTQIESLRRAATTAGEIERMMQASARVYSEQVILPIEEHQFELPIPVASPEAWRNPPLAWSEPVRLLASRDGTRALQTGIQASLAVMVVSVFIMLASTVAGLAGLYVGFAVFSFANYAAYRLGETNIILSPRVALMGIYAGVGLAATMVVAAIF